MTCVDRNDEQEQARAQNRIQSFVCTTPNPPSDANSFCINLHHIPHAHLCRGCRQRRKLDEMSGRYAAKVAGLQGGMWRATEEKRSSLFDVMTKLSTRNSNTQLHLGIGMSSKVLLETL
jgi:hypothetical protein